MATLLRTPPLKAPLPPLLVNTVTATSNSLNFPFQFCHSFRNRVLSAKISPTSSLRFVNFIPFASQGEIVTEQQQAEEPEIKDSADVEGGVEGSLGISSSDTEEATTSITVASLRSYKDALASNDESKIAEIKSFLTSIEDEKTEFRRKFASLTEELSLEKARVFGMSAEFENFRKRTERERVSLVAKAQEEVVENLLPVLDNFERAKSQLKLETQGEEKISSCYQSIYKQFLQVLGESIGKPFESMGRSQVSPKPSQICFEHLIKFIPVL